MPCNGVSSFTKYRDRPMHVHTSHFFGSFKPKDCYFHSQQYFEKSPLPIQKVCLIFFIIRLLLILLSKPAVVLAFSVGLKPTSYFQAKQRFVIQQYLWSRVLDPFVFCGIQEHWSEILYQHSQQQTFVDQGWTVWRPFRCGTISLWGSYELHDLE